MPNFNGKSPNNARLLTNAIGLCGFARCGKDTMYSILTNMLNDVGIQTQRIAFADELKKDCDEFLKEKAGISAFTTNDEEKKIIRPFLVSYGCMMRQVDENYWIKKVEDLAVSLITKDVAPIFTDVRFPNEMRWVNKDLRGSTIYISRESLGPPNEEEERNDPILRKGANHFFHWDNFPEGGGPDKLEIEEIRGIIKKLSH